MRLKMFALAFVVGVLCFVGGCDKPKRPGELPVYPVKARYAQWRTNAVCRCDILPRR